jgi:uncharacterized protein with PIN domain
MIIDTSAIVTILLDEPERRVFNEAIESAGSRAISAANFVETSPPKMSDKLQFVVGFRNRHSPQALDKLKFVGHRRDQPS